MRSVLLVVLFAVPAAGQELEAPPAAVELGLVPRRGILHCHSHLSHDSDGTPERIVAACRAVGVDFVAMTDHPSDESLGPRALRGDSGGVLFLAGAETRQILGVHLERRLGAPDTNGAIRETLGQGGLAFLSHPEEIEDWDALEGYTGMEIYNLHSDVKDEDPGHLALRGIASYLREPETCFLAFFDPPASFLARWDRLGRERRVVGVAGNDAHENIRWGRILADPYERSFRFVSTWILVPEREVPLTARAVLDALAAGRAWVGFGLPGPPSPFSFTARTSRGVVAMGDEVRLEDREERVRFLAVAPADGRIVLVRDGVAVAQARGRRLDHVASGPGVYRIEVHREFRGRELPWILSNPIYVR